MNKLLTTPTGGFPFVLDDLRWIDDGIRDGFKGLASFLATNCVLSGVTPTGFGTSSFTYTAGYILLNGEVLAVDASAAPIDTATNTYVYVEVITSNDSAGLKVFEDSSSADTYQIRKGVLNAYATAQAGKVLFTSLLTAEKLISDMIVGYTHEHTKRQSWALAADDVVSASSAIIPLSPTTGNAYNLNIDAFDGTTALTRFSAPMPDGTWSAIRLIRTSGASQVIIEDGTATNNGIDTNGKSYLFKAGEIAWFIWTGGKARLVNGYRLNESWTTVTCNNGVTGSISLRLLDNGDVAIMGQPSVDWATYTTLSTFATVAAKYRPTVDHVFVTANATTNDIGLLLVKPSGEISFVTTGSGSIQYTFNGRVSTL